MDLITVREAAEKWGVTVRRVQGLCNEGKIKGAVRLGGIWMLPAHAVLPSTARRKQTAHPMPRKSPFLDMTDLYNQAGSAEACAAMLVNNYEAHSLFEACLAYRRGDIDYVYKQARFFLSSHSGFYAILGGGMLLALCAIWQGDVALWHEAKKHICEAPCRTETEREIVSLSLAIIDSSIYDNKDYPDWFIRGNFELLPADSHPAAKIFYVTYLYMNASALASRQQEMDGLKGLSLMRVLPYTIEPLITQAVVDRTVIPEIYLRLSCAVVYHNSGRDDLAIPHMDKAVALALPDRLYGILTEYIRHFGGLLEERIALVDDIAMMTVVNLYRSYSIGWARISSVVRNRCIAASLNHKEHEVAKLTAYGYTPGEIAGMLRTTPEEVDRLIAQVIRIAGVQGAEEFASII